ncbi:hypothetical protein [Nocardia salmonicida]|uniref:hypothetical protein n=1 Tax=Nocardia salmonicida TaxID=53431 RepID=UPI0033FB3F2B
MEQIRGVEDGAVCSFARPPCPMDGPKDWHSVRRFNNFAEVAVWLATVVVTAEQASSASGVLDVA